MPDRVGHDLRHKQDDRLTLLLGSPGIQESADSIPRRSDAVWQWRQGKTHLGHINGLPRRAGDYSRQIRAAGS